MADEKPPAHGLTPAQLESFVTVAEGAKIRTLSVDTFREVEKDHIVKVSPRRDAIKLKHVLMLKD